MPWAVVIAWLGLTLLPAVRLNADTLADIKTRGRLVWGGDAEGGGPYIFPDPDQPRKVVGFEVDLAAALAGELGVTDEFVQGSWEDLPALLETRRIDVILNGYELTSARAGRMEYTSPYYRYRLALLSRTGEGQVTDWEDLRGSAAGQRRRVGALSSSGAYYYLRDHYGDSIELAGYKANTDALREVETGKLDATVADLPVYRFYRDQFPGLRVAGTPIIGGYYVVFLRSGDDTLRQALNAALSHLIANGRLQAILDRYGVWNEDQESLGELAGKTSDDLGIRATRLSGWQVLIDRGPLLVRAAGMTVFLACASMPIAILLGLMIALGRLYGPKSLQWLLVGYIEIIRGTPLMLQLYVLFYLLPQVGLPLPPKVAAIAGLAINYSAYEAEIYRSGLLAIPAGQMDAALALGMTTWQAVRRIILPQAVRLVIPPVTNDFIALFKDTSVCSVITVMELTGAYSVARNDTLATGELAAMTALLYLLMSVPLAHLSSRLDRRGRANSALQR